MIALCIRAIFLQTHPDEDLESMLTASSFLESTLKPEFADSRSSYYIPA